jgi:hypothetical protein
VRKQPQEAVDEVLPRARLFLDAPLEQLLIEAGDGHGGRHSTSEDNRFGDKVWLQPGGPGWVDR